LKNVLPKNCVEKFFKKIDKKIKNRFFLDLFYHVFGRFSVRGVQKHHKKNQKTSKTNLTLVLFWSLTQPPWGSPTFLGAAPPLAYRSRSMVHVREASPWGLLSFLTSRFSGFLEQPKFQSQDFKASFTSLHTLVGLQGL
jgi:hypothetical protein